MRRGYGIYREVNKHHEQQHVHARVVYMREAGMCGTLKQVEDGCRSMWRTGVGAIMTVPSPPEARSPSSVNKWRQNVE